MSRNSYLFIIGIISLLGFGCDEPKSSTAIDASWEWEGFTKADEVNPILSPSDQLKFKCPISGQSVNWEQRNVLNPSAVVKDGKVYLLYRAQDETGTSRIGMAVSEDGLNFEKMESPVFYPDNDGMKNYEWHHAKDKDLEKGKDYFDGVEDPRVVGMPGGGFLMTYTAYDGKTARLCFATSEDLFSWDKKGLVLKDEKYKDTWSKAGAIVSSLQESQVTAASVGGKYWMYYGDTDFFMATSEDLLSWTPLENAENGRRISVLHPRSGYFDSRLVEPGAYALLLPEGIHMIYNASNAVNFNDSELPVFTYAPGQVLFNAKKPNQVIERSDNYLFRPDKNYEREGEVNEVCFVEGLVYFREKWFLYYGTADSHIAVAVKG